MISEVYNAFRSVGMDEDNARAAAEALSTAGLASKAYMRELRSELKQLKSEQRLHRWMLGLIILVEIIPYLKAVF